LINRFVSVLFCHLILLLMALLPPQLAIAPGIAARRSADSVREIRALWVVRHALVSPVEVRRLVERASANGITDLIVQVRGRGDAYYNSSFEPRAAGLALLPAGIGQDFVFMPGSTPTSSPIPADCRTPRSTSSIVVRNG
jgi:uncharacterized lipoprotein YddW (UPF0748 family)